MNKSNEIIANKESIDLHPPNSISRIICPFQFDGPIGVEDMTVVGELVVSSDEEVTTIRGKKNQCS